MSIRWIRMVHINGEPKTLEIQLGFTRIGDRCYTRIGDELEEYYDSPGEERDLIVYAGIERLQQRLFNDTVTYPDGRIYDWK